MQMDIKSGAPFWTTRSGLVRNYPALEVDARCEVAIIGAGITGALIAHALVAAGRDVLLLDRRDVGWGSTSASTALLQYEIDTELADLASQVGEGDAVAAYQACHGAIDALEVLARAAGPCGFRRMNSLYLATGWLHARRLRREAELRQRHAIPVEFLDRVELASRFPLRAGGAILSTQAAQVDPYRMTHGLLHGAMARGARVHDRSPVDGWQAHRSGVRIAVGGAHTVSARWLVVAAGYEGQGWLRQRVARNRSSYALVSEPRDDWPAYLSSHLIWESTRPYLYMRSTDDGRMMVGGEDDAIDIPLRRDARVPARARRLIRKAERWTGGHAIEPGFAWAGTFAETRDGLPYFGVHPEHGARVLFAMAYGGNGITYSAIGAELIAAAIARRRHPLATLFGFGRLR